MQIAEKQAWLDKLNNALDDVRPHLAVDGGNVQVVDISPEYEVHVRWIGNCQHCEMSEMTLRAGVEQTLKHKYPEIQAVVAVN